MPSRTRVDNASLKEKKMYFSERKKKHIWDFPSGRGQVAQKKKVGDRFVVDKRTFNTTPIRPRLISSLTFANKI